MKTHLDVLDRRLDTYAEVARRRGRERATIGVDGPAHWKRFAAATGAALAGAGSTDAAIVHVVPSPPIRVLAANDQFRSIDMDNDFAPDFRVQAQGFQGIAGTKFWTGLAYGVGDAEIFGEGVFGPSYNYIAVKRFQPDDAIPAQQPAQIGSYVRTSRTVPYQGNTHESGNWLLPDTGFAGIVLGISGQPRAGWIKISTVKTGSRLLAVDVLSWAYETVPGKSIKAGQTTSIAIPGDYDGNGVVEDDDYDVWKSNFGNTVTAGTGADGNGNTKIDAADYTVWRNNFDSGSGSLSSEAAVPEPATVSLGMLALGAAGVAALRRRSK